MLDAEALLVTAVPLLVIAVAVGVVRRRWTAGRAIAVLAVGVYAIVVIGVTLFPVPIDPSLRAQRSFVDVLGFGGIPRHNVVPFASIVGVLGVGRGVAQYQIIGNLLLLAPVGVLAPLLRPGRGDPRSTAVLGLCVTLGIETAQLVTSLLIGAAYRAFDVDDLLLNTVGVVIGWGAWRAADGLLGRLRWWRASVAWLRGGRRVAVEHGPPGSAP